MRWMRWIGGRVFVSSDVTYSVTLQWNGMSRGWTNYVVGIIYGNGVSFELPKHMFKLMDKKIMIILRSKCLLFWTYGTFHDSRKYLIINRTEIGLIATKPVFGVSDIVKLKPLSSATEASLKVENVCTCSKFRRYDNFKLSNNKGADQTARMHRLVCAFVVCKLFTPKTGFLASRSK